ncbi:hypothetical protein [Actinomycetospora atypica]|uniref:Uncharacterized protein n=1 Tax=Actinomycetospora atypica TaxID=1290095 RepID=A0ABV9YHX2_9PSEU
MARAPRRKPSQTAPKDEATEPASEPTTDTPSESTTESTADDGAERIVNLSDYERPEDVTDVNLSDVSRCPLAAVCEACGGTEDRALIAVDSEAFGVLCMTVCLDCFDMDPLPDLDWNEAVRRITAHSSHLGVTVDVLYAAVRAEKDAEKAAEAAAETSEQASA